MIFSLLAFIHPKPTSQLRFHTHTPWISWTARSLSCWQPIQLSRYLLATLCTYKECGKGRTLQGPRSQGAGSSLPEPHFETYLLSRTSAEQYNSDQTQKLVQKDTMTNSIRNCQEFQENQQNYTFPRPSNLIHQAYFVLILRPETRLLHPGILAAVQLPLI